MKQVLVIAFSPVHRDPRVRRQLEALAGHADVTLAAWTAPPGHERFIAVDANVMPLPLRALRGLLKLAGLQAAAWRVSSAHRKLLRDLAGRRFDVVVANDVETLPVAAAVPASRRVFDAHEYAPRQFEHDWKWRMVSGRHARALLARYASGMDAMFTVSSGLAAEYRREYGLAAEVMPNATNFHALEPAPPDGDRIRLVHHGVGNPARHLEDMFAMMRCLDDRFSLDLYLLPGPVAYMQHLAALAAADRRVRLLPPVPMDNIVGTVNRYDVGIAYFRPATFNLANTLPNKFFEYVQARVAVATGPTPDIAALVARHGIGVVADSFTPEAMAERLRALDPVALAVMKQATMAAARELSFEHYAARFRAVVLGEKESGE